MEKLSDKTLIMIVGPTTIGKSTLMNDVADQTNDFARVSGFTTRPPRPNDEPGLYRYITKEEAYRIVESDTCVQRAVHPSTGDIYGTEIRDYTAVYNMKDTLTDAVEPFRSLPFRNTFTISMTADPQQWRHWFLARYPEPGDEAKKRLEEATKSISWSLNQTTGHHWLINIENKLSQTAGKLINVVRYSQTGDEGKILAQEMLRLIEKGVWI